VLHKEEDHGMRLRGQLEIAMPGSSSWTPCAPQGVKGLDNDDDDNVTYTVIKLIVRSLVVMKD
jgi:hypothetical protein